MKRLILGTILVGCMLFASNHTDLLQTKNIKNEKMKQFLLALEKVSPTSMNVIEDYYGAKTCSKDFYNKTTVSNMQKFTSESVVFGLLIGLKALNTQTSRYRYKQLIDNYAFMNCAKSSLIEQ
jgi:hypothetical protein